MFGIYEAGEKASMKGPIKIEESSSHVNIRFIRNNLTIK
jgi:hypothetical protein